MSSETFIEHDNQKVKMRKPGSKLLQDAQMEYNIKLASLIKKSATSKDDNLLSRSELDDYLKKLGIWSEKDQVEMFELQTDILSLASKIKKGGINILDGRRIAIDVMIKRQKLLTLISKRSQYEELTIESVADQHRFKFLMVKSVFNEDGSTYYEDIKDYENKETEKVTIECGKQLASWVFGYDSNFENNLVENEFLKKYNFMNENGVLIDKDGNFVDVKGNSIDMNDSEPEFSPFLDEEGNPIKEVD